MRRLDAKPFHLIVTSHVERQLREVGRKTARAIRSELETIAYDFGRKPPPWLESWALVLEVDGVKVEYEVNPENRAVIAVDVITPRVVDGD